jgi:PAS domain S-box-containing protein
MIAPTLQLLIVDDEDAHVEAIRRAFDNPASPTEIESVASLYAFQARVKVRRPDLALIDLNLPDGRALEVLTHPPEDAPFPILVMTAFGNQQTVVEVMKAGALDYVVKSPEAFADMPRTVERALREWNLLQKRKQADVALQQSEQSYRAIFNGTSDAIFIHDAETGAVLDVNDAMVELFGLSRDEALQLQPNDGSQGVSPHSKVEVGRWMAKTIAEGPQVFEWQARKKSGEVFWVEVALKSTIINGQRRVLAVVRDITGRKQAEEALRESEARYHSFIESSTDMAYIKDAAFRHILVNSTLAQFFQRPVAEIIGRDDFELMPQEAAARCRASDQQALEAKQIVVTEELFGTRCYESRKFRLPLSDGRMGIGGIIRDITERKQIEMALQQSEDRLLRAQAVSHVGNWELNLGSRTMWASVEGFKIYGLERTSLELPLETVQRMVVAEDRPRLDAALRDLLGKQKPYDEEYRIVRARDGVQRVIRTLASVECDAEGKPLKVVGTIQDITERKLNEDAMHFLAHECGMQAGKGFFEALAEYLAAKLGMDFVCIDRLEGDGLTARTVAVWCDGHFEDNATYALKDTPRGEVVGQTACCFPANVCQRFPHDTVLKDLRAESYVGVTLWGHAGQPIGLIAVIARHPLENRAMAEALLKLVAVRTASEIERQMVELALRESEQRFRSMLQNVPTVAVQGYAPDGTTRYWNRASERLYGYSAEEAVGRNLLDLIIPPEMRAGVTQAMQEIARTRQPIPAAELSLMRKDGSRVPVFSSHAIVQIPGHEAELFCIDVDLTERKQTEAAHHRLAMAVEQAAEIILITDTEAKILYTNPAFEKITGYTCAEACGRNPRMLQSGKHPAEIYRKMWATLTAGQVWSGHLINKRKDGTLFEEEATISPILDTAGQIVNYVAVKRDVTREVGLEAQHRQVAKMEAIGLLAGGVAHDFNNKLQIIMGCVEMLLKDIPEDLSCHADLLEIQDAARRSADLTRQLLAFSRQQVIAPVLLDLNLAISGSLKMIGRLIGENIHLNFMQHRDLGRVFIDPSQLDQILVNLAVNARDAIAGPGNIDIEVIPCTLTEADCLAQTDFVQPGDYLVLTIRDDGAGIPLELQGRIFEPFFTTKGLGRGTGLGLATVYGIVKQNHGAITVQSVLRQGTTFSIYLPRSAAVACAAEATAVERSPKGTETLLVVEDEVNILTMVQRLLTQQGYKVLSAPTPGEAVLLCEHYAEPLHLLLTDVIMPDMSGKELAERIQTLRPGIRVLYMSGYPADIMEEQGHLLAGLQVLQKPFSGVALAQRIRAALDAPPPPPWAAS